MHLACVFNIYDPDDNYWNWTYEARLIDPDDNQLQYQSNWDYKPGINGSIEKDLSDPIDGDYTCTVHWWVEAYDLGQQTPVKKTITYPIPSDETSFFAGWGGSGEPTTYGLFTAVLSPNKFDGRRVYETTPSPGTDGCYNADPNHALTPFREVTGNYTVVGWNVANGSSYGEDAIGWPASSVAYYRSAVSMPCETNFTQRMAMARPGRSITDTYKNNAIRYQIKSNEVHVWRDGTHASKSY